MNYIGDFAEDETVYLSFNTFTSDDPSASCTVTNLSNTDIHIHRDSGITQRNNAAGVVVSVDFDGITGNHIIAIDTSDNTVADFWITGHDYFVRAEGTTIDGATVNAFIAHFSIQNRFMRGTNSAALASTALSDATWTDAKAVHIDANISSRNATTPPTVTQIRQEMDANSTKMAPSQTLNDYKATGFSTHNAAAVWSVATRILTASTNFNDLTAAEMKAEVVAALADIKLDHLINIAVDTDWATTVHLDSVIGHMADVGTAATFDRTTDALEALRVRGDSAWATATGFSTHSAADVKTAIEAGGSSIAQILADTGELQTNQGNWITATGFSTHNAAAVKTAVEQAGSSIAQILADTNELELDWKDGGRLDLLIDAILLDTGTTLDTMIERILGMNQENFYIDTAVFTGANMTSCRIRLYSVAGSVGTAADVLATYNMTATYAGNDLASYKMVKA